MFMGAGRIGWIVRAEKFSELQEICSFHKVAICINEIMKVVGTSMVLEFRNANLLDEPLALNFVVTMDDRSTMEPR